MGGSLQVLLTLHAFCAEGYVSAMSIKRITIGVAAVLAAWVYVSYVPAYGQPVGLNQVAIGINQVTAGISQAAVTKPAVVVEKRAHLLDSGLASIPAGAPRSVQQALKAANRIIGMPYLYGGGHGSFIDSGYDCSGSVSVALHGAQLIDTPMASGGLMAWGESGEGKWITVYANAGHAFVHIAGLRLDTSAAEDPRGGEGPRWRPELKNTAAYVARSARGF